MHGFCASAMGLFTLLAATPAASAADAPRAYWGSVPCEIVIDRYRDLCRSEHARLGVAENEILSPRDTAQPSGTPPTANSDPAPPQRSESTSPAPPATIAMPAEPPRVGPRDITPEAIEAARVAIDKLLARDLKDPLSARQYSVSTIVQCARLVPAKVVSAKAPYCVCYEVNAKNAFGGYGGASMGIASLIEIGNSFMALGYDKVLWSEGAMQVCLSADFQRRDETLIHSAANQ